MAVDHTEFPAQARVVLASSGGADSLGALIRLQELHARGDIHHLSVVSVDHQIHPESASWSDLACAQAQHLGVSAHTLRVNVPPQTEHGHRSLEARARAARYQALADWMTTQPPSGVLVTAHHAEDQAETVLLAALRGSGAAGLAAMPVWSRFANGWHWRPFLDMPRAELRAPAEQSGLGFVSDPSNADLRHDRNYLRAEILPRLNVRWPQAVARLDQTAAQAGEDLTLLSALAELDAGGTLDGTDLPTVRLIGLPLARQTNVLRAWIRRRGALMPPRARLQSFVDQLQQSASARMPTLAWGDWRITRYRDRLYWRTGDESTPATPVVWADKRQPVAWTNSRVWRLVPTNSSDPLAIDARWLTRDWLLRARQPQDRIRTQAKRPSRTLKNWFQAQGVPPWSRESAVVIEIDGQLACLATLGVDLAFRPAHGAPGWRVEAVPTAPVVQLPPDDLTG
ncbi:tRNA lysidine(34) synthetase TilS [Halothiobacillus diazotrophicus]|uniref:tRNA(Ile)-lysidine synthase n=1 Tax=Halothiobacillus diazotrophicus TaxID=1860122 RepID=A0A191ZFS0_9GAMM|nr:tRNA lysidine(34) synthetase TilS [Halothiobacillus diazotrophicus]ANJ66729.1 tRNA lysidine(34) synthetase TilS [Halothiobacillus diazotrophicus]